VLASFFALVTKIDISLEPREVNGHPGAIVPDRDDKVIGTLTLDILGGQVRTIRSVLNPDKLRHLARSRTRGPSAAS